MSLKFRKAAFALKRDCIYQALDIFISICCIEGWNMTGFDVALDSFVPPLDQCCTVAQTIQLAGDNNVPVLACLTWSCALHGPEVEISTLESDMV